VGYVSPCGGYTVYISCCLHKWKFGTVFLMSTTRMMASWLGLRKGSPLMVLMAVCVCILASSDTVCLADRTFGAAPVPVPSVSFGDLVSVKLESAVLLRNALLEHGMVQITSVPNFSLMQQLLKDDVEISELAGLQSVSNVIARQLARSLHSLQSDGKGGGESFAQWLPTSPNGIAHIVRDSSHRRRPVVNSEFADTNFVLLARSRYNDQAPFQSVHGCDSVLHYDPSSSMLVSLTPGSHQQMSRMFMSAVSCSSLTTWSELAEVGFRYVNEYPFLVSQVATMDMDDHMQMDDKMSMDDNMVMDDGMNMGGGNDFCSSMGMTMSMSGFFSAADKDAICVNLFVESATLDSPSKFGAACLGIFLMGMVVQMCSRIRIEVNARYKKTNIIRKQVINFVVFGGQLTLGYLLMLVAMTYCAELFTMVVLGLTTGYAMFHLNLPPPTNTDPCCDAENEMVDSKTMTIDHIN
jgi:hypothetical protein